MSERAYRPHDGLMDIIRDRGVGGFLREVAMAVRACGRGYAHLADEIASTSGRATTRDILRDMRAESERVTEQARKCLAPEARP